MGYFVEKSDENLENLNPRKYLVKKVEEKSEKLKNYKRSILVANGCVTLGFSLVHTFMSFYNVNSAMYLLPISLVIGTVINLKEHILLLKNEYEKDDLNLRLKIDDLIYSVGVDRARDYLVSKRKEKEIDASASLKKGLYSFGFSILNVAIALLSSNNILINRNSLLIGINGILALLFSDITIAKIFESVKHEMENDNVLVALDLDELKRIRK